MFDFSLTNTEDGLEDHGLSPKELAEHKIDLLPWIVSPFKDNRGEDLTLELRHESNNLELFFDLFFIANLSTFTSTHSIVDKNTLVAYIGLFAILWFTWFQITLHDVRFSIDSVYERVCKVIQFVIFVGFAFVGSEFNPGGKEHNNTNFRVLCILLFASRCLFAIQYGIALYFIKTKTKALTLPISLTITSLVLIAGSFYSMVPAFSPSSGNGLGIYYVWYIILAVEFGLIIGLSTIWRQLSFKKTHLMERMGLLTLMVIGEGAIGVTKTIAKVMGKTGGLTVEGCGLVICIVLIMVFLWMFYFDNHPNHHYGTIRQQFWAGLHFPLHIGIVGVVEGSQQIALTRQIFKMFSEVEDQIHRICVIQHLDGTALANALTTIVKSMKLEEKLESKDQASLVLSEVVALSNQTGICSEANTANLSGLAKFPADFNNVMIDLLGAIFQSTGIKLPSGVDPSELARSTFLTVYIYFWGSVFTTMVSFAALFWLTKHKEQRAVFFEHMAIGARIAAALVAAVFGAIAASQTGLYYYIKSPGILPTVAGLFFLVVCADRVGRQISVRRLRQESGNREAEGPGIKMGKVRGGSHSEGRGNSPWTAFGD
ncbi:bacterial low temperature requirement A protein-domain-containing protein [Leptodontidium sp. MPI-SDFR-AT-0119]|nr:bacterial low temperature requirement A protein-domain-containing protein [Leptodontidium sp. MPI-SDFR-AT-0119]